MWVNETYLVILSALLVYTGFMAKTHQPPFFAALVLITQFMFCQFAEFWWNGADVAKAVLLIDIGVFAILGRYAVKTKLAWLAGAAICFSFMSVLDLFALFTDAGAFWRNALTVLLTIAILLVALGTGAARYAGLGDRLDGLLARIRPLHNLGWRFTAGRVAAGENSHYTEG